MNKVTVEKSNDKLAQYTLELLEAKRNENEANAARVAIEEKIANLIKTGAVGSKTVDAGNGFKVTIKRGLIYKADVNQIRLLDLPSDLMPVKLIPSKYEFDGSAYEKIINHDDRAKVLLSQCVKTTPKKPYVSIKAS